VINEYEAGKAIPDNAVLGRLERELKIKLRGSNIGTKLESKPSK
jgi:ribosome-binding protein aMBF1 (putative translation factor)